MGQPKKRRSPRKQGLHRAHQVAELARRVNARSPVKVILGRKAKKTADKKVI
jgi:hypothetical protein